MRKDACNKLTFFYQSCSKYKGINNLYLEKLPIFKGDAYKQENFPKDVLYLLDYGIVLDIIQKYNKTIPDLVFVL